MTHALFENYNMKTLVVQHASYGKRDVWMLGSFFLGDKRWKWYGYGLKHWKDMLRWWRTLNV